MSATYDADNYIVRIVNTEYFPEAATIYYLVRKNGLEQRGIVETEIDEPSYSFKHKKYIISYPCEWTSTMYKDAALFHLDLFIELDKYGLTLKDGIPNNIVFDFYRPVFVDFSSIVQTVKLQEENWLTQGREYADYRFAVIDAMFIPYMLIPQMALFERKYSVARQMLSERACNCGAASPTWNEVYNYMFVADFARNFINRLLGNDVSSRLSLINYLSLFRVLTVKKKTSFVAFCQLLRRFIDTVDIVPPKSGYVFYYENKNEKLDFSEQAQWRNKQKNVFKIIENIKPKRVLDIGGNTGWFSILAARLGAEVISIDVDESSSDSLYLYTKSNKLQILPLVLSFDNLTKEIWGAVYNYPEYEHRDFKSNPLYLPATRRFKSDLVLCLGLLHHLILGEGKTTRQIFQVLSALTINALLLEFISLDDELIQSEPSFFSNISKYNKDNYNSYSILDEGKKHFRSFEIMDSNPSTRQLYLFKK